MSHPNQILFSEGINYVFDLWQALKLAVTNEWGGPESKEKKEWMKSIIIEEFGKRGKKLEVHDIEDILNQIMSDEFEVVLEDDSAYIVAKDIFNLYKGILAGDQTFLQKLRDAAARRSGAPANVTCAQDQEDSDSDGIEDDEGMC